LAAFSPDHAALRASKRRDAFSGFPKTLDFAKRSQFFEVLARVDVVDLQ
jgi:hypothetical protein